MPIFVSRFSSAGSPPGAGLARARVRTETDRQDNTRASERADRLAQSQRGRESGSNGRVQDRLPASTQTAESIRDDVRTRANGNPDTRSGERELPTQATLPGVRTVRTSGRRSAEPPRVGDLDRSRADSGIQNALNRFAGLREAREATFGGERVEEVRQALRDIPAEARDLAGLQARQLNGRADAAIRLARANEGARGQTAPAALERASVQGTSERPTAEQISRANTTPEIQENLRGDSARIERGLRVDAEIQSQQNLRQTARTAARASEQRRESRVDENRQEVRELNVQERRLERQLRETRSEIQDLRLQNDRLQSTTSNATATTAANLANRTPVVV